MTPPRRTGASPVCPQNQFNPFQRDVKNGLQPAYQLRCNDRAADPASVSSQLATTQNRISTGQRVSTASDNAAYWSIATSMRADNAALSAVSDSLGLSAATVDTEYTALTAVVGDKTGGLTKLAGAAGRSQDRWYRPHQDPGRHHPDPAGDEGYRRCGNLQRRELAEHDRRPRPATFNLVSSFSRVGGTPTIGSITLTIANYSLYTSDPDRYPGHGDAGPASVDTINICALTDSTADQTTLDGYITQVTTAINSVASAAADLGAVKNRISTNTEFVKTLMDSVDRGVGQLVDADMNAESTRLQALQIQQQLGVQALSIANQNSQSILSLFK